MGKTTAHIGWLILAVAGTALASASGAAIAFNSSHQAPAAVAAGGLDLAGLLNWGLTALGGSAGILGLVKALLGAWSPTLGKVAEDPLVGSFVANFPATIQLLLGSGTTAVAFDVNEKIGASGLVLTGKLTLSKASATVPPAAG